MSGASPRAFAAPAQPLAREASRPSPAPIPAPSPAPSLHLPTRTPRAPATPPAPTDGRLTVQTNDGLEGYTETDVAAFGTWLGAYDMRVIIRWNHEMNGNW